MTDMNEMMLRVKFDPAQRRQALVTRLLELRTLIPQFEEEKARLEGMIALLDEIAPPVQQFPGPTITASDGPPAGLDDEGGESSGEPEM